MRFARIFQIVILVGFLLEVLDPTTTFVRERVVSAPARKVAEIKKKASPEWANPDSQDSQDDSGSQDAPSGDGFLAGSAVLPVTVFPPQPHSSERSIAWMSEEPVQGYFRSIQRPPSRS